MNEERKTEREGTMGHDVSEEKSRPEKPEKVNIGGEKQTSTAELAGRGHAKGGTPRPGETTSEMTPLMPEGEVASHRAKWRDIQSAFVDQPQDAVRNADGLVAEIIQTLTSSFADQRQGLEDKWSRGSEVSTEDLRKALQQYRSFFERLLAA